MKQTMTKMLFAATILLEKHQEVRPEFFVSGNRDVKAKGG